ncbi:MAG: toll/interleukin-1 receptor domain-containing protein [Pseudomonadota bacterium]
MARIFISYRREDSQYQADRLRQTIAPFVTDPQTEIFVDVDNIPPGVDFVKFLDERVGQCEVLLALIGRGWLSATNPSTGMRRLDEPTDFVREEIAAALRRNIPVVPVLLDGAVMPNESDLPEDLKPLARRNGVDIDRQSFDIDAERMMEGLGFRKGSPAIATPPTEPVAKPKRGLLMAMLAAVVVAGAAFGLFASGLLDGLLATDRQAGEAAASATAASEAAETVADLPPQCANTDDLGMTWNFIDEHAQSGAQRLGCSGDCDAIRGNTSCSTPLPVLCLRAIGSQKPADLRTEGRFHGWAGGEARLSSPRAGCEFASIRDANAFCAAQFGESWRVASFHDGGGHSFWVESNIASDAKMWVHIRDQEDGTCWRNQ